MDGEPGHLKDRARRRQIVRTIKRRLILGISLLIAAALVLCFKAGQDLWPAWLIEWRTQIIGAILSIVFFLIVLSPVIVEVSSNPRPLSGPGRNPWQGGEP